MLLFSVLIAGSFSFGKLIADDIDPIALTAMRFLVAALALGVIMVATGRLRWSDYRKPWRFFVLGGLFAAYFVLMFFALRLSSSLSLAVIFTTMPLAAAAIDRMFFRQSSSATVWGALMIGAVGALWVVFEGSWAAFLSFSIGLGEILFFIGTLSHAAYAVLIPRLRLDESVFATAFGVAVAAAILLMIVFWSRVAATDWAGLSLQVWSTLIYLAIMATVVTLALITFAASKLPSAKVTAYTYLTPFWVVLLDSVIGMGLPPVMVLIGGIPIAMALTILFVDNHDRHFETGEYQE